MKTNWPAVRQGCLILGSIALTGNLAFAQSQEGTGTAAGTARIFRVAITKGPLSAAVRVEGGGRLDVHAARMQDPERLVLDFADTRAAVRKATIAGTSAPVLGVRVGQYRSDVTRVVIDLTEAAPYQLSREAGAVVVSFASQKSAHTESAMDSAAEASAQQLNSRPSFQYSASAAKPVHRSASAMPVSAPRFSLPGELTQPSVVLASFSAKSEPARPSPSTESTPPGGPQTVQQANATAANLATAAAQGASAAPAPVAAGKYTGEPISVNLKDVDLRDFFRLIHEISGLNVVLDPAVKGSLTIVLDEVPWDQALDIVLQNNSLDKQLNGNVLRIATRSTLRNEAETQRDLEKAQAEAVAPVTVTRVLSYGKAATMKDTLKRFLSVRGEILSDDRSNQLIIRDIPSVIPVIDNLIRQLDRKSQQVEIEARVVSASRSFSSDIGTQLGFAGQATHGRNFVGGDPTVGQSTFGTTNPAPPVSIQNSTPPVMPLVTNLASGAPTSGLMLAHRSPNFAVDFFITAAEAKGVGKLLSKPKVITQNNEKATVKQGTKIPIQTTINNTISVQFIDAVLKLEVTPQITAEGTVFMDVLVENTQIDNGIPRVQGIPALDTQSAETKVLVADGGTVVIGGIIVSTQRVDITDVPIVGSLPLIGRLFKRTAVSTSSQELLFFLTPRIIPG